MIKKPQCDTISPHLQKLYTFDLMDSLSDGNKTRKELFAIFRDFNFSHNLPGHAVRAHEHFIHCLWFGRTMEWIEEIGETVILTEKGRATLAFADRD